VSAAKKKAQARQDSAKALLPSGGHLTQAKSSGRKNMRLLPKAKRNAENC